MSADSECGGASNLCRDLLRMGFKREVAYFKMDHGAWNVAPERLGIARQKKGIVLSPGGQQTRLVSAEVLLKCRIQRDVALVLA
jgi:hypothetical protein